MGGFHFSSELLAGIEEPLLGGGMLPANQNLKEKSITIKERK
jgi:hypothetical protein